MPYGLFCTSHFLNPALTLPFFDISSQSPTPAQIWRYRHGSWRSINASIHSQVLMVFFLPLVLAGIHSCFAFHLVKEILMGGFGLWDVKLLVLSAVLTFLAFAVFYVIVYLLTAREYYKIVSE